MSKKKRPPAATRAKRMTNKLDRLAVKIVTLVSNRVDRDGMLEAYDGIEAAREIRELMVRAFRELRSR